jgi:prepilin-type N-terminal cleavage/methylation domain-containing protein
MKGGLTLIELMVVMAIIALLSGGSLAAYNSFNQTQTLKAAAEDLKNNLRLAQGKALSQEKPGGCSILDGYQVEISSSAYLIRPLCGTLPFGTGRAFSLPAGITLSTTASPLVFRILGGGATDAVITISGFGKPPLTVTVTKTGEIY